MTVCNKIIKLVLKIVTNSPKLKAPQNDMATVPSFTSYDTSKIKSKMVSGRPVTVH